MNKFQPHTYTSWNDFFSEYYFEFFKNLKIQEEHFYTKWYNIKNTSGKLKIRNTHNNIIYYKKYSEIHKIPKKTLTYFERITISDKILISSFKDLSCFINNE